MDFKYFIYSFIGILMSYPNICCASMLSGLYKGPDRWLVELVEDNPSEYKLIYGDIVEKAKNCSSSELSICLTFDFIDILVPRKLAVNEQEEYLGSAVAVNEYLPIMEFGNTRFKDVYKLTIARSGLVNFEGGVKKVPGGKKTFEILYSKSDGLLGFRELPSSREDFFLIDWRSFERRSKK